MNRRFDALLRIRRRAMDELRLALQDSAGRVSAIEEERTLLARHVRHECAIAAGDCNFSTHDWLRARLADRHRLAAEQQVQEQALDALRERAGEAYGALRVAEEAARRHRERLAQMRARAGQAEADDMASARLLLRARHERMRERRHERAG